MDVTTRGERWTQVALLCLVAVLIGCLLHQTVYRERTDARFLPPVDEQEFAAILAAQRAAAVKPACPAVARILTNEVADTGAADYRSSSPNGSPAGIGAGRS